MAYGMVVKDAAGITLLDSSRVGAFFGGIVEIAAGDTSGVYRGDGLGGRPNLTGVQTFVLQYGQRSPEGAFNFRLYNVTVTYCKLIGGVESQFNTLAPDRYPKITYSLVLNTVPINSTATGIVFLLFLGGQ